MRISREEMFMQMAEVTAKRSTCYRNSVGCIITFNHSIVSTGYNGPAASEPHCFGISCPTDGVCTRSRHAEANAIIRAKWPLPIGSTYYVTVSPCRQCAQAIYLTKPNKVYYRHPYRLTMGIDLLIECDIPVYRMTTSGYVYHENTKQLVEE